MASGTQTHGKMLDYEQFIDHQLSRTRAKIKATDILVAVLSLLTAVLSVLFLEVILDHAVGLPVWARRVILLIGIAAAATFAGFRIARPLIRRVNGFYAAHTIEQIDPHFKNSLINYLDLRKHKDVLPKRVLRAIETKAVNDLARIEVDAVVNQRRVLHTWYALMGVIMAIFLYYALAPKSMADSVKRAFLADVVRPTNTRFDRIKPGDDPDLSEVVAGSNVAFSTETFGVRPAQVLLNYSVDGGNFFLKQEFAEGVQAYDPWQTTLRNVQQPIEYYLSANDAESRHYRIKVLPAPMVTGVTLDYAFPKYTGVPPRSNITSGNIEAIEGTTVTVHARTNQPAKSAYIDFGQPPTAAMEIDHANPQEVTGKFLVRNDGSYTVKFRNEGGQMNPEPVLYDIRVTRDAPPTVKFTAPLARLKAPSNAKVDLDYEAADDFGVKSLVLSVYQGNESLTTPEDFLENKKPERKVAGRKTLDLAPLKLQAGSILEYWLVVRDTKEPSANLVRTEKQVIEIEAPASPEELAKLDDQRQQNPPPQPPNDPNQQQQQQQQQTAANQPGQNGDAGAGKDQNQPANAEPDRQLAQNNPEPGDQSNPGNQRNDTDPPLDPAAQRRMEDLAQKLEKLGLNPPPPENNGNPDQNQNQNQPQTGREGAPGQTQGANPQSQSGEQPKNAGGQQGNNTNSGQQASNQQQNSGGQNGFKPSNVSQPNPGANAGNRDNSTSPGTSRSQENLGNTGNSETQGNPSKPGETSKHQPPNGGNQGNLGTSSPPPSGANNPQTDPTKPQPGQQGDQPGQQAGQPGQQQNGGQSGTNPNQKNDPTKPQPGQQGNQPGQQAGQPGQQDSAGQQGENQKTDPTKPQPGQQGNQPGQQGGQPGQQDSGAQQGGNQKNDPTKPQPGQQGGQPGQQNGQPGQQQNGGQSGTNPNQKNDPTKPQPGQQGNQPGQQGGQPGQQDSGAQQGGNQKNDPTKPQPGQQGGQPGQQNGQPGQQQNGGQFGTNPNQKNDPTKPQPGQQGNQPGQQGGQPGQQDSAGQQGGNQKNDPTKPQANNQTGAKGENSGDSGGGNESTFTESTGKTTGDSSTNGQGKPTKELKTGDSGSSTANDRAEQAKQSGGTPAGRPPTGDHPAQGKVNDPGEAANGSTRPETSASNPNGEDTKPQPGQQQGNQPGQQQGNQPGQQQGNQPGQQQGNQPGQQQGNQPGQQQGNQPGQQQGNQPGQQQGNQPGQQQGNQPGQQQGNQPGQQQGNQPGQQQGNQPGQQQGNQPGQQQGNQPGQQQGNQPGQQQGNQPGQQQGNQPGQQQGNQPGQQQGNQPGQQQGNQPGQQQGNQPGQQQGNQPGQQQGNQPGQQQGNQPGQQQGNQPGQQQGNQPGQQQGNQPGQQQGNQPGQQQGNQPGQQQGNQPGQQQGNQPGQQQGNQPGQQQGYQPGQQQGNQPGQQQGNQPGQQQGNQPGQQQGNQPGQQQGNQPGQQQGNQPGQQQGNQPGEAGMAGDRSNGGGRTGMNNPLVNNQEKIEPLPRNNDQPPANPGDSIAPDVPQSELVTRTIKDLLQENKFTPDLEQQLGMTRDEAEQFVKKFEKRPEQPPIGEGREIQASPGEEKVFDPARKAPEFNTSGIVSKRTERSGTALATDSMSGLTEGGRSAPPPELRRQWERYRKNLAGSKTPAVGGAAPR